MLKTPWRWLFPRLQRALPAHHGNPLLAAMDRMATVFHALYENGNYDPASNGEAWLLNRLASTAPQVIFDVGANRGDYARLALAACTQARLYAFEPMPTVFQQLACSLGREPRAEIFQLALADRNGELNFYFDPSNTGNTSAIAGVQDSVHDLTTVECLPAQAQRLDDFCSEHSIASIHLLKIDVEGFEASVLRGGDTMISEGRVDCIQFEYGKANLFSRFFVHDYMRDYGANYLIGKLYPRGICWFGRYSASLDDLMGPNLVMVKRERRDLIQLLSESGAALPE